MKNLLNKKLKQISKIILLVLSLSFSYSFAQNEFLRNKLALIKMIARYPRGKEDAKQELFKVLDEINSGKQEADQEEMQAILQIANLLEIQIVQNNPNS